jgi:hypothetical protein
MWNKFLYWLRNKLNNLPDVPQLVEGNKLGMCRAEDDIGEKKIQFTMYFADGGVILQRYHYDHQKDRSYRKLLLIPDDKDVAEEVGNFVAMEILRSV